MGAYSDRVIADGASNYWRLNETSGVTAVDIVGGKNGTGSGGVTLGVASPLADGTKAVTFNGTTGKVSTTPVSFPIPISYEFWVKFTPTGVVGIAGQLFTGFPAGADTITAFVSYGPGQCGCYMIHGPGDAGRTNLWMTTPAVDDGQWHQVVWVFPTPTTVVGYIDGVMRPQAGGVIALPMVPTTKVFELGTSSIQGAFLNGSLDEVAIYPLALTPSQIELHYGARATSEGRDLNSGLYAFLPGTGDLTTRITAYLKTLSGDYTNRWKQMERNAGF